MSFGRQTSRSKRLIDGTNGLIVSGLLPATDSFGAVRQTMRFAKI